MRASHIAVRAALVLGAAGAGIALWSAADATAAYADHRPAAAVQPGGLLGGLPEQAADRAHEVVNQVATGKPVKASPGSEPETEPTRSDPPTKPEPTDEPHEEPQPHPSEPTSDPLPDVIDEIEDTVDQVGEVIADLPAIPAPTPVPAPLPGVDLLPVPAPAAPGLPLPALVVSLYGQPVLIAPAPAPAPPVDIRHDHPAQAAGPLELVDCVDQADPLDMTAPAHRITRIHPRAAHLAAPGRTPCDPAGGQDLAAHLADVTAPSQSGGQLAATVPAGASLPAVTERLSRLLPRSDLPSSRTTHLDPRPA